MKYYYLDETSKQFGGYWHGIIGGALIEPKKINDLNYAINDQLNKILVVDNEIKGMQEIHINNLFPDIDDDDLKLHGLEVAIHEIKKSGVKFLLSYAKFKKDKIKELQSFGKEPEKMIFTLAFLNVSYWVQEITKYGLLQMIIDAGFNDSYKRLHDIYMSKKRSVDIVRLFWDESIISTPNFRNILSPAFVDSRDERLIQISDAVIGVEMWKQQGSVSEFKQKIIDIVSVLDSQIEVNEVEWNKKNT